MVHTAARYNGMCIAVYMALVCSWSTRFLACIMIEFTPQHGLRLQYQPSDSLQALVCAGSLSLFIHSYKCMIISYDSGIHVHSCHCIFVSKNKSQQSLLLHNKHIFHFYPCIIIPYITGTISPINWRVISRSIYLQNSIFKPKHRNK